MHAEKKISDSRMHAFKEEMGYPWENASTASTTVEFSGKYPFFTPISFVKSTVTSTLLLQIFTIENMPQSIYIVCLVWQIWTKILRARDKAIDLDRNHSKTVKGLLICQRLT